MSFISMNHKKTALKISGLSIIGNLLLAAIKGLAGFFGNSYALIADAIESLSDVLSSFLVWIGLRYATKPADDNHPYGHGRIEPLLTFMVSGILLFSALVIAYQSIIQIRTPHELPESWTLYILGAIIIWKEIAYRVVVRKSILTKSSALRAEAWHQRSDAITSLFAFAGISIALILGKGFETADDWAALFSAVIIIYNAYKIFRPAWSELMDENIHHLLIESIRKCSLDVNGILDTEKCYIRKIGMMYHVDLHVMVDPEMSVKDSHDLAHELKDHLLLNIPNLEHVLIHVEPFENHF